MSFVFSALLDPGFEEVFFLFRESKVGFWRWHDLLAVFGKNADQGFGFRWVFRIPSEGLDGFIADIEAEVGFLFFFIGAVAEEAFIGKNRQDLAGVRDFILSRKAWLDR